MFSKLLLASVAAIGLLLTGPQKASAQVVYACVSSIGNIAIVASATTSCPPSAGGPTWTKVTLGSTPGAIAERQYNCSSLPQTVATGADVTLVDSGIGFGGTLPSGTTPFTNFLLRPGIYQAHLSTGFESFSPGQSLSFGTFPSAIWPLSGTYVSGDRLFSVTNTNTIAGLLFSGGTTLSVSLVFPCLLILTQLQ